MRMCLFIKVYYIFLKIEIKRFFYNFNIVIHILLIYKIYNLNRNYN